MPHGIPLTDLLTGYLIPAARSYSFSGLKSNRVFRPKDQVLAAAHPPSQAIPALPPMAKRSAARPTLTLNGSHGWSTFKFIFDRPDVAALDLMYGDKSEQFTAMVGLDGLYRVTETQNYGPVALKGYWKDAGTFVLTQQFLRDAERIIMEMTFSGDKIKRISEWMVEVHAEESDAVLLNR